MLAAQCNKISTKAQASLSDGFTKGFHPWKRPITGVDAPGPLSLTSQRMPGLNSTMSIASHGLGYSRSNTLQSCAGSYGSDLFYPTSNGNYYAQNESGQSTLSQKVYGDTGFSGTNLSGMYSRMNGVGGHLNDSWSSYMPSAHGLKSEVPGSVNSATSWWDMHSSPSNWLTDGSVSSASLHSQITGNYANSDYPLSHPFSANGSSFSPLLQDTYKSILPSQNDLSQSAISPFLTRSAALTSLNTSLNTSRSQRRYTGRATCDCPNCQEAERLGPAGAHLRKKNIHSCHIPGCGKVYGKTSHLKAHLRYKQIYFTNHSNARCLVYSLFLKLSKILVHTL